MKKLFILAAAALLTLGIASCERDTDPTDQTSPTTPTDPTNPNLGQWVDLGLPSGLLWYSVNLGATAPEQYGDYYAWGETHPKETYNWSTYSYATVDADGSLQTLTKYNTSSAYGTVDNLTTIQPSDDAATQVLGGGARIPTLAEWQELLVNTTAEWTTLNNVNGCKFTAPNGNSLFLPAAGGRYGSEFLDAGSIGNYWSASHVNGTTGYAFHIAPGANAMRNDITYSTGCSVRLVRVY